MMGYYKIIKMALKHPEYQMLSFAAVAVALAWILHIIFSRKKAKKEQLHYRKLAQNQREYTRKGTNDLALRLTKNGELMTKERKRIVELSMEALLDELKQKKVSVLSVLRAYQAKAIEATKKYNCVVEFIMEAEEWAVTLDKAGPGPGKPLFGLPISIKENIAVSGYDSTLGIAKYIGKIQKQDSAIVAILKHQGAIPFCRTNVPQTLYSYITSNPIYGTTRNPCDVGRTPGGSSGGEAALVSAGGSLLGVGSDLGGSIRIPGAFCGIPALKPTSGRLTGQGITSLTPGLTGLSSSPGFLGRDVSCILIGMRTLLDSEIMIKLDPEVLPLPWNEKVLQSSRPLRIGYYESMAVMPATPGCRRALLEAKSLLEKRGHHLVPVAITDGFEETQLIMKFFLADGAKHMCRALRNEDWESCMNIVRKVTGMPTVFLKILSFVTNIISKRTALVPLEGYQSVYDYMQDLGKRKRIITQHLEYWRQVDIDALIGPAFPFPALKLSHMPYAHGGAYTSLYNLLDFPAGVVPVSKETKEDQYDLKDYPEEDIILRTAKSSTQGGEGLPLAVAVVARPWQEELVLRVMKDIEEGVKKQKLSAKT